MFDTTVVVGLVGAPLVVMFGLKVVDELEADDGVFEVVKTVVFVVVVVNTGMLDVGILDGSVIVTTGVTVVATVVVVELYTVVDNFEENRSIGSTVCNSFTKITLDIADSSIEVFAKIFFEKYSL